MFLFHPSKSFQEIAASMRSNNIKRHYEHFNVIRIIILHTSWNFATLDLQFVLANHILLHLKKQHMAGGTGELIGVLS